MYSIPNRGDPTRPYQKGITASEWTAAYSQLMQEGRLTHGWFREHLPACMKEGSCNFTTVGGIFEMLEIAEYGEPGCYVRVGQTTST